MDRGHSTHQPMPGGTKEYKGRASGTERSSEDQEKGEKEKRRKEK